MADDEFALRRTADRAAKAKALIENETLTEAFDALRSAYIGAWENTDLRDMEGREKAWIALTLINRLRKDLQTVLDSGKIAVAQLAVMEAQAKRKPRA